MISIGPYHYGKPHLRPMEELKMLSLNSILDRNKKVSLDEYFNAMILKEREARQCYAEAFDDIMSPIETGFAEMMLLDGCFIVELIRANTEKKTKGNANADKGNKDKEDGQIIKVKADLPEFAYDLLLLENQLPLSILVELFDMSKKAGEENESFVQKALCFFCSATDHHQQHQDSHDHHLLGSVYRQCVSKLEKRDENGDTSNPLRSIRNAKMLEEAGVTFEKADVEKQETTQGNTSNPLRFIRNAKMLEDVEKQETTQVMSLFDIRFVKETGIMKIPSLRVDDITERIFRNLIAYEQAFINDEYDRERYVTDYAVMMDCLINSDKDVELLQREEVIDNWLGDHEALAKMFNSLCKQVKISKFFYYHETHEAVRLYCGHPWNEWKATLRHDYFNIPWALISFLAALLLLIITVAQFILSFF